MALLQCLNNLKDTVAVLEDNLRLFSNAATSNVYYLLEKQEALQTELDGLSSQKLELQVERALFEREKQLCQSFSSVAGDVVKLNVGGKLFESSKSTLCSVQGSMLNALFSGRHNVALDSTGRFFLDRDPGIFKHLLNYMRGGSFPSHVDKTLYNQILDEFDYFCIPKPTYFETLVKKGRGPLNISNSSLVAFPLSVSAFLPNNNANIIGFSQNVPTSTTSFSSSSSSSSSENVNSHLLHVQQYLKVDNPIRAKYFPKKDLIYNKTKYNNNNNNNSEQGDWEDGGVVIVCSPKIGIVYWFPTLSDTQNQTLQQEEHQLPKLRDFRQIQTPGQGEFIGFFEGEITCFDKIENFPLIVAGDIEGHVWVLWELGDSFLEQGHITCLLGGPMDEDRHKGAINHIKIMDKDTIVTASSDFSVKIWSIELKTCVETLAHQAPVSYVDCSTNFIATAAEKILTVWECKPSFKKKWTRVAKDFIKQVKILTSQPNTLVSASENGDFQFWDINTGNSTKKIQCKSPLWCFDIENDVVVTAGSNNLQIWKLEQPEDEKPSLSLSLKKDCYWVQMKGDKLLVCYYLNSMVAILGR